MEVPFVSVVIPAFNSHQSLRHCLVGLQQQTYPNNRYEVIVVDNNSEPTLEPIVAQFAGVIYEIEPQVGSYAARNCGVNRAVGEIIALTDSDCVPEPDWIEKGVQYICEEENCGLVAGKILLLFESPQSPNIWELCDQIIFGFRQQAYIENRNFAATANAFTFRHVFEKVGLFDPNLKSGGDVDWGNRVAKAGYKQRYGAAAIVSHPARASRTHLAQKARRLRGGRMDRERKQCSHFQWVTRNVIRLLMMGRRVIPGRQVIRRLRNYHTPAGERQLLPFYVQVKLALAYCYICTVQEMEVVRLLFGAESRRQ